MNEKDDSIRQIINEEYLNDGETPLKKETYRIYTYCLIYFLTFAFIGLAITFLVIGIKGLIDDGTTSLHNFLLPVVSILIACILSYCFPFCISITIDTITGFVYITKYQLFCIIKKKVEIDISKIESVYVEKNYEKSGKDKYSLDGYNLIFKLKSGEKILGLEGNTNKNKEIRKLEFFLHKYFKNLDEAEDIKDEEKKKKEEKPDKLIIKNDKKGQKNSEKNEESKKKEETQKKIKINKKNKKEEKDDDEDEEGEEEVKIEKKKRKKKKKKKKVEEENDEEEDEEKGNEKEDVEEEEEKEEQEQKKNKKKKKHKKTVNKKKDKKKEIEKSDEEKEEQEEKENEEQEEKEKDEKEEENDKEEENEQEENEE